MRTRRHSPTRQYSPQQEENQNMLSTSTAAIAAKGAQLIWKYRSPSNITTMGTLARNIVVLGTDRGHLVLLDWTKRTKERSFSNDYRPLILQSFIRNPFSSVVQSFICNPFSFVVAANSSSSVKVSFSTHYHL